MIKAIAIFIAALLVQYSYSQNFFDHNLKRKKGIIINYKESYIFFDVSIKKSDDINSLKRKINDRVGLLLQYDMSNTLHHLFPLVDSMKINDEELEVLQVFKVKISTNFEDDKSISEKSKIEYVINPRECDFFIAFNKPVHYITFLKYKGYLFRNPRKRVFKCS